MKRIRTHGRDVVLLALTLIICALGVSYQMNDEIVVPEVVVETPFSHGHFDQECRLKMSFIALQIEPLKQGGLPSDISWLHLENPLPLVYLRSEDRKDFLLTCQATHHKREGAVLSPVFTKKHGYGLVEGSLELKAPFPDYESLALREFLGIPRFHGGHRVHRMGRFYVLAIVLPGNEDFVEDVIVMALNPDSDLKSLYHNFPIGSALSDEERAAIIRRYRVEDPFVLERLEPTWNPYAPPP